jgi:AraC family transcriptional regulator
VGQSSGFVRSVGGDLVSSTVTTTSSIRIEVLRRTTSGRMHWHFRQPELSLFMFSKGVVSLDATIDGRQTNRPFNGKTRLAVFPATMEIEGAWNVGPTLDYTVVFLNPSLVDERLREAISAPTIGFEHDSLARGLSELCREATAPDNMFEMMAEGWAIQALAHISRISRCEDMLRITARGGLPGCCLRRLEDFVRANLAEAVGLDELAGIAGLSKRHFLRAFQESVGVSPYQYVLALRIEEAKHRLARSAESMTEIALATGFGHAQHFSTSFRKATGETPSSFRQRALS